MLGAAHSAAHCRVFGRSSRGGCGVVVQSSWYSSRHLWKIQVSVAAVAAWAREVSHTASFLSSCANARSLRWLCSRDGTAAGTSDLRRRRVATWGRGGPSHCNLPEGLVLRLSEQLGAAPPELPSVSGQVQAQSTFMDMTDMTISVQPCQRQVIEVPSGLPRSCSCSSRYWQRR